MMETMTETMKDWGKQVKEFLDENRELIFMIAGAIAAVAAVCAVVGLLCRKK
jgi:nitrate reductase gamma subunit